MLDAEIGWTRLLQSRDEIAGAAERTNARPLHLNPAKNRA